MKREDLPRLPRIYFFISHRKDDNETKPDIADKAAISETRNVLFELKESYKIKEDLYFDFQHQRKSGIDWESPKVRDYLGFKSDGVIFLLKKGFGKEQLEGAEKIKSTNEEGKNRPQVLFLVQDNEDEVSRNLKTQAQNLNIGFVVCYKEGDMNRVRDEVRKFAEPIIKEKKKKGLMKWLLLLRLPLIIAVVGLLLLFFGKREINPTLPVNENPIAETYVKGSRAKNNSTVNNPPPGNPSEIVPGNKDDNSKHTPSQSIVPPQKGHNGQEKDHPEKPQPKVFEKNVCAIVSENISKNIVDYVIAGLKNANLGLTFPEDVNGNPQWRIELKETVQEMERETEGKIDYKAYVTLSASIIKDNEKFGYCEVKESARSYESTMKALDSARENAKDLIIEKIIGRIKQ